ncbi:MAG: ABC transporter ATP-binding protein, partial [Sphingobium sp.]
MPAETAPPAPARQPAPAGRGGARLLWETMRPFSRRVAGGMAVGMAWSLCKLAVPALVARAIDQGVRAHDPGRLALFVALILAAGLTGAALAGLRRYLGMSAAFRIEGALRERLFRHLLHLDMAYHAATPAGEVVTRATSDLQQIQQPFVNVPLTASNAVMFAGASALLVAIDPWLALFAMGPVLGLFLLAWRFSAALGPHAVALQREAGRFASLATDAIAGIRALKGLGLEEAEGARGSRRAGQVQAAALALARVRAAYLPLIDLLPAIGVAAVLWIGGDRVAAGRMTIGEMVQFSYYVLMMVGPLRNTGMTLAQFQRAFVSAGLIDAVLATAPSLRGQGEDAGDEPAVGGGSRGAVLFEGVHFGHGEGEAVLRGLDLSVAAGETVAIVGVAGAGKTSLVGLIPRLHDAAAGRVVLDGRDVRAWPSDALRAHVGMVFEDAFLFSGTVRANIAFARPGATDAEVEAAARAAGAHDFIRALDGGYDAPVGERGYGLSGGQRQRIALARALITDPAVLILDAATSAVDASKDEEIREALSGRGGG